MPSIPAWALEVARDGEVLVRYRLRGGAPMVVGSGATVDIRPVGDPGPSSRQVFLRRVVPEGFLLEQLDFGRVGTPAPRSGGGRGLPRAPARGAHPGGQDPTVGTEGGIYGRTFGTGWRSWCFGPRLRIGLRPNSLAVEAIQVRTLNLTMGLPRGD